MLACLGVLSHSCAPRNRANSVFKVTASNSSQRNGGSLREGQGEKNGRGNTSDYGVPSNISAWGSTHSRTQGEGVGRARCARWVVPSQCCSVHGRSLLSPENSALGLIYPFNGYI